MEEVVIGFSELRLYVALVLTVTFFVGVGALIRRLNQSQAEKVNRWFGIVMIGLLALNHPLLAFSDHHEWDIHRALPLHLCSITFVLVAINCFLKNRALWMITLFWGIIGGVHSIITPQLTHGDGAYFLFFYYFKHGAILMFPFIHRQMWDFRLGKRDWITTLVITNIYVVLSFGINWFLNRFIEGNHEANYFYTWEPPIANNPIIQGDWPWYLIPCEIALLAHLIIIQLVMTVVDKRKQRRLSF